MEKYDFTILKNNLEANGYQVSVFDNKEAAADYMNQQINNKTVGLGGSVTIHDMKLFEMLSAHNEVYWHDKKPENMIVTVRREYAEIYLCCGLNPREQNMKLF